MLAVECDSNPRSSRCGQHELTDISINSMKVLPGDKRAKLF
ncbi:25869_t:CDS:1, partial [Gigaspora rosea]